MIRPVVDVGEHVAEPVVAVGDRHALLGREALGEAAGDLLDRRQLAGLRALPLGAPALHLAFDVALAFGEVAEADLVDVDGVQVGEHVDQVEPGRPTVARRVSSAPLSALSSTTPSTKPIT